MGYEIQLTGAPAPSGTGSAEPPRRPPVDEQENEANLGGQAHWSFGGMFLVDSPLQRRLGVRDSFELAWQDWQGSEGWDRLEGEPRYLFGGAWIVQDEQVPASRSSA